MVNHSYLIGVSCEVGSKHVLILAQEEMHMLLRYLTNFSKYCFLSNANLITKF